jgi:hypothetical protein
VGWRFQFSCSRTPCRFSWYVFFHYFIRHIYNTLRVVNCLVKKDLESVVSFDELKYSEYNGDFENEVKK